MSDPRYEPSFFPNYYEDHTTWTVGQDGEYEIDVYFTYYNTPDVVVTEIEYKLTNVEVMEDELFDAVNDKMETQCDFSETTINHIQ